MTSILMGLRVRTLVWFPATSRDERPWWRRVFQPIPSGRFEWTSATVLDREGHQLLLQFDDGRIDWFYAVNVRAA